MIINLAGGVDNEMMNSLVKGFTELKKDDKLHIYFSTFGGEVAVAEAIIDLINKNKEYIGMTFYGEVFSSGMQIFLKTECSKWILPDTTGMYHYSFQDVTITEGGKPSNEYGGFCVKEMKKSKSRTIDYLKTTKLTSKEINSIKAGKDVYFCYERMLELL